MEHYICTGGCGGVSEKPKTCGTPTCSKHGQALLYCDCENPEHLSKLSQHPEREKPKDEDKNPAQK